MRGKRIAGLLVVLAVLAGARGRAEDAEKKPAKAPFREYTIGEEIEREAERLRIAAVWLPPVTMDGHPECNRAGPHVVHLECDVHATRGNQNGFALGEWIPYMAVAYKIEQDGKVVRDGKFLPMVAKDGPHYGATIEMPGAGRYKLTYRLEPPSAGGLGRHTDPVTGVAPWWKPFEVSFDWDYKGVEAGHARAFAFTSGGTKKVVGTTRWKVSLGSEGRFAVSRDEAGKTKDVGSFDLARDEAAELWDLIGRCELMTIENPPPSLVAMETEVPFVFALKEGEKSREVPMVRAQVASTEKLAVLVDRIGTLIEKYAKEKPALR